MSDDGAVRAGTGWLGELGRVVVPVECAGCGALDVALCAVCRRAVRAAPRRCEGDAPRLDRLDGRPLLPVWARAEYDGVVREVVLAWKDRGRADLTGALREDFAAAAGELAPVLRRALDRAGGCSAPVLVVGAPSSRAAVRRRGANLVAGLAEAAATALTEAGVPARGAAVLEQRRGVRDQVGLGARARGGNLRGRIRLTPRARVAGRFVVVVDDVLTTGATLASAVAALERSGALVVAGLVLAATPRPGRSTGPDQACSSSRLAGPTAGERGWQRIR